MLEPFLALFLKSPCPLCQRQSDRELCRDCGRQLQAYRQQNPLFLWHGDIPLFVWGRYEGKLKQAIATMKYDRHPDIGRLLGSWMGESWRTLPPLSSRRLTVIPIPLHSNKLKSRGFNQAEAIAQGFCGLTGYALASRGLTRIKDTEALFSLAPEDRKKTMQSAFQVGKNLPKQVPILVIDDIYTTGTTIKEAVEVLRKQGYQVAGAIALSSSRSG
jgi:ComF family protein